VILVVICCVALIATGEDAEEAIAEAKEEKKKDQGRTRLRKEGSDTIKNKGEAI
jgi:hypothetical protein